MSFSLRFLQKFSLKHSELFLKFLQEFLKKIFQRYLQETQVQENFFLRDSEMFSKILSEIPMVLGSANYSGAPLEIIVVTSPEDASGIFWHLFRNFSKMLSRNLTESSSKVFSRSSSWYSCWDCLECIKT